MTEPRWETNDGILSDGRRRNTSAVARERRRCARGDKREVRDQIDGLSRLMSEYTMRNGEIITHPALRNGGEP
jgi:hypothetical protein